MVIQSSVNSHKSKSEGGFAACSYQKTGDRSRKVVFGSFFNKKIAKNAKTQRNPQKGDRELQRG
jgi:hypothetical protein